MRKVGLPAILVFHLLAAVALVLGIGAAVSTVGRLPLGEFRAVAVVAGAALFVYASAILVYRLFLKFSPLEAGEIEEGSRREFAYHVHLFFDLLLFSPVLGSRIVPVPFLRLIYLERFS